MTRREGDTVNGRAARSDLTWTNERRRLSELVPWPRNPRTIKGDEARRLGESLEEFGQPETFAIGPADEVYNGHQRLRTWLARFGDIEVDVRVASRPLTEKEREKLTVFLHRGAVGEWDFDVLEDEFEIGDLLEWGFEEGELGTEPSGDDWSSAFGDLPTGDKLPFEQMTFTLATAQAEVVRDAMSKAKGQGPFVDTANENSNGNALARICEAFLGHVS